VHEAGVTICAGEPTWCGVILEADEIEPLPMANQPDQYPERGPGLAVE
jgi:hypothetical protein